MFELFAGLLVHLEAGPARAETVLAFEMKALRVLGLEPDIYESKHTEGARVLLRKLTEESWPLIARLKASEAQSRELQQFLHGFLIYHLERLPRGRAAALRAG